MAFKGHRSKDPNLLVWGDILGIPWGIKPPVLSGSAFYGLALIPPLNRQNTADAIRMDSTPKLIPKPCAKVRILPGGRLVAYSPW